jgi:cyanophycinase-like exopeptidase
VLAGGDVAQGWRVFTETKLKERILERLAAGAVVIGVSAGAAQLGRYAMVEKPDSSIELLDTFARVPFILSAHDERRNWETLRQTVQLMEGTVHGIGIPSGGGLIFHPDETVEAVRHPLQEFSYRDGKVISSLIYQPG